MTVESSIATIYNEAGIYKIRQALGAGVEDRHVFCRAATRAKRPTTGAKNISWQVWALRERSIA